MVKASASKADKKVPASPARAFTGDPIHSNLPSRRSVSSKEMFERLKGLAPGWDKEMESLLSAPPTLELSSKAPAEYYSMSVNFEISEIISSAIDGRLRPTEKGYGIGLYEKANSVYFVFADLGRRIIVKDRIVCYQDDPPEGDWGTVKKAVKAALALAEKDDVKKKGLVAVYDGTLRTARPEKPQPGIFSFSVENLKKITERGMKPTG